jgi:hypothetical protein
MSHTAETSIGPRIRLAPIHMLAILVFLAVALVFGEEFEGVTGFKLAGVQLIAAAAGCLMYVISMGMFAVLIVFERNYRDDRARKLLVSLRIKPLYFQQFISAFAFFGRSLLLVAPELLLLSTIFPSIVPTEGSSPPIFLVFLVLLFASSHLAVEWKRSCGFLNYINSEPKAEDPPAPSAPPANV